MKWVFHLHHNRLGGNFSAIQYIMASYPVGDMDQEYIDIKIQRNGSLSVHELIKSFWDVGFQFFYKAYMQWDEEEINSWMIDMEKARARCDVISKRGLLRMDDEYKLHGLFTVYQILLFG